MNIESKRYKAQGAGIAGLVNILDKQSQSTHVVFGAPDASALALMSEKEFDKQMAALVEGAK